jgi:manganese/zinc/iron transport system ATP- binding protein
VILLENVQVQYQPHQPPALWNISLTVAPRQRVVLVGPNGSGKSTLLKTILGTLRPTSGRVEVFGLREGACHHRVAYVPQRDHVQWNYPISVEKVVLAGRYVHLGWLRRPRAADYRAARTAMETMGIASLANRPISDLSGGQRQRAMIARALAQEADLLLFDEPLNTLDREAKATFRSVLEELSALGKTILVATHEFTGLRDLFQQTIELEQGRLVRCDSQAGSEGSEMKVRLPKAYATVRPGASF